MTTTAAAIKLGSPDPKLGFLAAAGDLSAKLAAGTLPPEKVASAPQLIFNQRLDAWLTAFFVAVLWAVILDMLRNVLAARRRQPSSTETAYVASRFPEAGRG